MWTRKLTNLSKRTRENWPKTSGYAPFRARNSKVTFCQQSGHFDVICLALGPDFVRKHIFNKHAEKIEEVKKEVEFFNNYLRDPKRPMLAEAPQPKREEPPTYNHPSYGSSFGGYGRLPPYYNQGYSQRSRGYAPRSR